MKIHYISCHSILEYDEVSILTEIGHDVFSNGAYRNPDGHNSLPRPGILGAKYYPEYEKLTSQYPKNELPPELVEPFDMLIFMAGDETDQALVDNWPRIKHKKVCWRSIGQSLPHVERMLKPLRDEGLKIIRYSPMEERLSDYIGQDVMIRFAKDPTEFIDWTGNDKKVMNITQSIKARRDGCHYDHILEMMAGFPAKVFGPGNANLSFLNGGNLTYDLLKGQLRDSRVFVYGGTWPAPYTLSFIEAWMTGIPVVSIGKSMAENLPSREHVEFFEIPNLIKNGVNGFVSDNMGELRSYIKQLLDNDELAHRISQAGRTSAIEIFGKPKIRSQWKVFLESLQ